MTNKLTIFAISTTFLLSFPTLSLLAQGFDDFQFQGEYIGNARVGGQIWRRVGLQVIAMKEGNFDAVLLQGGLPGAGWDRETKWKLQGQLENNTVTLSVDEFSVRIDGRRATIRSSNGNRSLGTLRKIQRTSPTMHARPIRGAVVLFDGSTPEHLEKARVTDDGLLNVGFNTKEPVGDFRLHLEFRTPFEPDKRGQGRGNSGVYIQRRYEVQILDSFGLEGKPNECGGLYRQKAPDVNMCLPPRSWQTYDIFFTAARWDEEGNKTDNARITVLHNGVAIHDDYEIVAKTGAGRPESAEKLPILFQDHRNPVHFRNIWIVHGDPSELALRDTCTKSKTCCSKRRLFSGRILRRLRLR